MIVKGVVFMALTLTIMIDIKIGIRIWGCLIESQMFEDMAFCC